MDVLPDAFPNVSTIERFVRIHLPYSRMTWRRLHDQTFIGKSKRGPLKSTLFRGRRLELSGPEPNDSRPRRLTQ